MKAVLFDKLNVSQYSNINNLVYQSQLDTITH